MRGAVRRAKRSPMTTAAHEQWRPTLLLTRSFIADYVRNPVNLVMLVLVPLVFVLVAAGSIADAMELLGGRPGPALETTTAGWAAGFLSGLAMYFQIRSARARTNGCNLPDYQQRGCSPPRAGTGLAPGGTGLGGGVGCVGGPRRYRPSGPGDRRHADVRADLPGDRGASRGWGGQSGQRCGDHLVDLAARRVRRTRRQRRRLCVHPLVSHPFRHLVDDRPAVAPRRTARRSRHRSGLGGGCAPGGWHSAGCGFTHRHAASAMERASC